MHPPGEYLARTSCAVLLISSSFGHFLPDRIQQAFRFQFVQRVTGRFQVVGQCLRQSLVEGGVFHINNHGAVIRSAICSAIEKASSCGGSAPIENIPGPIGQDDQQRLNIRVDDLLLFEHLIGHQQSADSGRLPAHRYISQGGAAASMTELVGGRIKVDRSFWKTIRPTPVAPLVGVRQQATGSRPLVAAMRSATAIDQEASTRNRIRLAAF